MSTNEDLLEFVGQLATGGGQLAVPHFQHSLNIRQKNDHTIVTNVDVEIETWMREKIAARFPDDAIEGEEFGQTGKSGSQHTWYLDPLDGTTNFVAGNPLFGTMVAVRNTSQTLAAAVYLPVTQSLFSASIGSGLLHNQKRFSPHFHDSFADTTLILECGKLLGAKEAIVEFLANHICDFRSFRRFGTHLATFPALTSGFGCSIVFAANKYEIFCLSLLLEEAGVIMLNMMGKKWNANQDMNLFAVAPGLKMEMLKLLAAHQWENE